MTHGLLDGRGHLSGSHTVPSEDATGWDLLLMGHLFGRHASREKWLPCCTVDGRGWGRAEVHAYSTYGLGLFQVLIISLGHCQLSQNWIRILALKWFPTGFINHKHLHSRFLVHAGQIFEGKQAGRRHGVGHWSGWLWWHLLQSRALPASEDSEKRAGRLRRLMLQYYYTAFLCCHPLVRLTGPVEVQMGKRSHFPIHRFLLILFSYNIGSTSHPDKVAEGELGLRPLLLPLLQPCRVEKLNQYCK